MINRDVLATLGLWIVGKVAPGAVVHRLVNILGSTSQDAAEAAYMALVQLGPRATPKLLEEARLGNQRASILQVIGDMGDPDAISELEAYLNSEDRDVASAAAESILLLGELKSKS